MNLLDIAKNYLTQPSTWKGALKLFAASGLFTVAPEVADPLVSYITQVIAGVWGIVGVVDFLRNEHKPA